jgi:hypothetical protein
VKKTPGFFFVSVKWRRRSSNLLDGNQFTINGEGFSPGMNGNRVYIGPLQAQIVNATTTSITVIAPPAYGVNLSKSGSMVSECAIN